MIGAREHFDWSIGRALQYLDSGQPVDAMSSIIMDLGNHDGTRGILPFGKASDLQLEYLVGGAEAVRRFITRLPAPTADTVESEEPA